MTRRDVNPGNTAVMTYSKRQFRRWPLVVEYSHIYPVRRDNPGSFMCKIAAVYARVETDCDALIFTRLFQNKLTQCLGSVPDYMHVHSE
jgi:hypothetical protein